LTDEKLSPGLGTYTLHGYIYSSLAGILKLTPKVLNSETKKVGEDLKDDTTLIVEVRAPGEETVVPAVGDVVTCKVLSVNPR
jgi:exosome complex component CSL4